MASRQPEPEKNNKLQRTPCVARVANATSTPGCRLITVLHSVQGSHNGREHSNGHSHSHGHRRKAGSNDPTITHETIISAGNAASQSRFWADNS